MASEFKVNNFDLLRLAAATQVVLVHALVHLKIPRPPLWWLLDAFPGVPIFFAISGFLISASFERTSSVATYAQNRLLRIGPGLWCVVAMTVLIASMFGFNFFSLRALAWFVSQCLGLIFTPKFLADFGFGSYNGALWTIPIELQFYVLLPLAYIGTNGADKKPTTRVFLAWLFFVLVAYVYAQSTPPLAENATEPFAQKLFRYSFVPHIYMFLTGWLLQRWHAHRSPWIAGKGAFWIAGYLLVHALLPDGATSYVVGSLFMAVATISAAYTRPGLSTALLRGNDISYGVYIYHGLLINILLEFGIYGHPRHLLLVLLVTLMAGYASWKLVERPFLRRKKQTIHAVASRA